MRDQSAEILPWPVDHERRPRFVTHRVVPDLYEELRRSASEPTLPERAADLFAANIIPATLGFCAGMFATVGLAFVWSLFL